MTEAVRGGAAAELRLQLQAHARLSAQWGAKAAKLLERVPIPVKELLEEPTAKINVLLQVRPIPGVWPISTPCCKRCDARCNGRPETKFTG